MTKLLIYIGENTKFNVVELKSVLFGLDGVRNARQGSFIGAIFECEYDLDGDVMIVRISEDEETVTVEGLGEAALSFALKLQSAVAVPLRAIDTDYSFDVALRDFHSSRQLREAIGK